MSNKLKRYFFTGLVVLLPIAAGALVVTWLFGLMDGWTRPITMRLFGLHIPGLGIVITAALVMLAGILSSNMIGRWLLGLVDQVLLDVPVFKTVYNMTKQVMQVFSPGGQKAFRSVVLLEHPRSGVLALGFVTAELGLETGADKARHLAVYVPTNHMYLGDVFIVRPDQLRKTSLSVQDGIQAVISAGVTLPAELKTELYGTEVAENKVG